MFEFETNVVKKYTKQTKTKWESQKIKIVKAKMMTCKLK